MARALVPELNNLMVSNHPRQPAFQVLVYDVRSTINTINDIVAGNPLVPETGPRDFTDEVLEVTLEDRAGDFVNTGIAASSLGLTLVDPNDLFNPLNRLLDPTGDGRWLRSGNVVRVKEGDASVPEADWPTTFTGVLIGSPGVVRQRTDGGSAVINVQAVDRSAKFIQANVTSVAFGIGTTYLTMATDIAKLDMGLDDAEIDFAGFGTRITGHRQTQFVEQAPLVSLAQIMMVDGFMPRFNGEGKLTQSLGNITGFPDRVYTDQNTILSIEQPFANEDIVNSVCIIGLDANLSKITQPRQELAEAQLTVGYFAQDEDVDVYWSEDRTQIAENVTIDVKRSVNGAINFGGSEEFTLIPAPGGSPGHIGVNVSISTGFAPYIIIALTIGYVAAAWIPDTVLSFIVGETLPVGRFIQALALIAIMLIMTNIGRVHAEFDGSPIEFVYKEIRACARQSGLLVAERNEVVIENHMVQDQSTGDSVVREILFRQLARGNPRVIRQVYDVALEADDIIELPDEKYGARRFLINTITRTLRRGEPTIAELSGFEITSGLAP